MIAQHMKTLHPKSDNLSSIPRRELTRLTHTAGHEHAYVHVSKIDKNVSLRIELSLQI